MGSDELLVRGGIQVEACSNVEQGLLLGTGTKRLPSPFLEEIHDLMKRRWTSLKH